MVTQIQNEVQRYAPIISAILEPEAGESLEPTSLRLAWAT